MQKKIEDISKKTVDAIEKLKKLYSKLNYKNRKLM